MGDEMGDELGAVTAEAVTGDYDVVLLVEQALSPDDARQVTALHADLVTHLDRLRTRAQRILKILARS